jgi:hypothetical protein
MDGDVSAGSPAIAIAALAIEQRANTRTGRSIIGRVVQGRDRAKRHGAIVVR